MKDRVKKSTESDSLIKSFIYEERAVAFLDVLGFREKMIKFENEAKRVKGSKGNICSVSEDGILYSPLANEFISIFTYAVNKLEKDYFTSYLFSDNICIVAKRDEDRREKKFVELLYTISEIYYELAKNNYFLRGGIDYGYFIVDSKIALGNPLAGAVDLEKNAAFPRVVLSRSFMDVLKKEDGNVIDELEYLITRSCEVNYLNVFNHVLKLDDRVAFFCDYKKSISNGMKECKSNEKNYLKYQWLAKEFNRYIETYGNNIIYRETDIDANEIPEIIRSINEQRLVL